MKLKLASHIISALLFALPLAEVLHRTTQAEARAGREAYVAQAGQHWDRCYTQLTHPVAFRIFAALLVGLVIGAYELVSHGVAFLLGRASRSRARRSSGNDEMNPPNNHGQRTLRPPAG